MGAVPRGVCLRKGRAHVSHVTRPCAIGRPREFQTPGFTRLAHEIVPALCPDSYAKVSRRSFDIRKSLRALVVAYIAYLCEARNCAAYVRCVGERLLTLRRKSEGAGRQTATCDLVRTNGFPRHFHRRGSALSDRAPLRLSLLDTRRRPTALRGYPLHRPLRDHGSSVLLSRRDGRSAVRMPSTGRHPGSA